MFWACSVFMPWRANLTSLIQFHTRPTVLRFKGTTFSSTPLCALGFSRPTFTRPSTRTPLLTAPSKAISSGYFCSVRALRGGFVPLHFLPTSFSRDAFHIAQFSRSGVPAIGSRVNHSDSSTSTSQPEKGERQGGVPGRKIEEGNNMSGAGLRYQDPKAHIVPSLSGVLEGAISGIETLTPSGSA